MSFKLFVFNPSDYPRKGYVTTNWKPIYEKIQQYGILLEELALYQASTQLPVQIDLDDPSDPSSGTLLFSLVQQVQPGLDPSNFISVGQSEALESEPGNEPLLLEVMWGSKDQERGIRLSNRRLIVWLNLIPAPQSKENDRYAGSASSILLDQHEALDPFMETVDWRGHDPDKRCLQVEKLQLQHSAKPEQTVSLDNKAYQLVSKSIGSVRTSITIASPPFDVAYDGNFLKCKLYRRICLYADTPYLTEELFLKELTEEGENSTLIANFDFTVCYLTHIFMGHYPLIKYQSAEIPKWFTISSDWKPFPGYGFATDLHLEKVMYPYEGNERRFSWQMQPCKSAKCLHLFVRDQQERFEQQMHRYWHESIDKPLIVKIQ